MADVTFIQQSSSNAPYVTGGATLAGHANALVGDLQVIVVATWKGLVASVPAGQGWVALPYQDSLHSRAAIFWRIIPSAPTAGVAVTWSDKGAATMRTYRNGVSLTLNGRVDGYVHPARTVEPGTKLLRLTTNSFPNTGSFPPTVTMTPEAALVNGTGARTFDWFAGIVTGDEPASGAAPTRTTTSSYAGAGSNTLHPQAIDLTIEGDSLVYRLKLLTARIRDQFNSLTLNKLADVDTATTPPVTGQALVYDGSSSLWKPGTVASGGGGGGSAPAFAGVGLRRTTAAQANPAANTFTPVQWDVEDWDSDGYHDNAANRSRITVPAGRGGKYLVHARYHVESSSSTHYIIAIAKNGTGIPETWTRNNYSYPGIETTTVLDLVPGDYVEVQYYGPSATIGSRSEFSAVLIGGAPTDGSHRGAKVLATATQTFTTAVAAPVVWSSETWDSETYWVVGSPSRLTVPAGRGGRYLATAAYTLTNGLSFDQFISFAVNGVEQRSSRVRGSDIYAALRTSTVLDLEPGDYVEVLYYQASGSNKSPETTLGAFGEFALQRLQSGDAVAGTGTTAKRFWYNTRDSLVVNPVPAASTLVPGMTLTIPASDKERMAFVDATVAHTGTHTNRVHIAVDGAQQSAEVTGNMEGGNTTYNTTLTRVPVLLSAGAAHTIETKWNASDSTASVTLIQRTMTVDVVDGSSSSGTTGLALASGGVQVATAVPAGSVDEFSIDTLDPAWVRVDPTGTASRMTWLQGNGVLSGQCSGTTGAAYFHALLRPIGAAMVAGDALITRQNLLSRNAVLAVPGFGVTDGVTYGTGTQMFATAYIGPTSGSSVITTSARGGTGFNASAVESAALNLTPGQALWLRLVMVAANTWRTDVSLDGVQWWNGGNVTLALTPTHMGFATSPWGTTTPHLVNWEFLRRVSGIA